MNDLSENNNNPTTMIANSNVPLPHDDNANNGVGGVDASPCLVASSSSPMLSSQSSKSIPPRDRLTSLKSMLPPLSPHLSSPPSSSAPITIASSSSSPCAPRIGSVGSSDNLAQLRFSSSVHNLSLTGASPRAGGAILPMPSSSPCCSSSHHLFIEIDSPSPHPSNAHSLSYTPSPCAASSSSSSASSLTLHTPIGDNHGGSSVSRTPASSTHITSGGGSGIPRIPRVERYQSYQQYHHHLHGAYSWNDHPPLSHSHAPHEVKAAAEGASTLSCSTAHHDNEEGQQQA